MSVPDWISKIDENCQNYPEPIVARQREEYKRNVHEKIIIWVTSPLSHSLLLSSIPFLYLYILKI